MAAALEALAIIGDPAAIPALRRMIERELDGRLRRRGKEVVRDLGENAPLAEDVRRLRDEVGELRAVAATLRERIELIEAAQRTPTPPKAKAKKRKRR
jgi:aminopeptidase N